MADKRKPVLVLLLRIPGTKRKHKIELFDGYLFSCRGWFTDPDTRRYLSANRRYRIRVDGRWVGAKGKGKGVKLFTWYEFRDLLWRSIKGRIMRELKEKIDEGRREAREAAQAARKGR